MNTNNSWQKDLAAAAALLSFAQALTGSDEVEIDFTTIEP